MLVTENVQIYARWDSIYNKKKNGACIYLFIYFCFAWSGDGIYVLNCLLSWPNCQCGVMVMFSLNKGCDFCYFDDKAHVNERVMQERQLYVKSDVVLIRL